MEARAKIYSEGHELDAKFEVEWAVPNDGGRFLLTQHSRSGGGGLGGQGINRDYTRGQDVLIRRLADNGAVLEDAYVDSRPVRELPLEQRRLMAAEDYPIQLQNVLDLQQFRERLGHQIVQIGQAPGAQGGNSTKRVTYLIRVDAWTNLSLAEIADRLAGHPTDRPASPPLPSLIAHLIESFKSAGFVYEPWQVATLVTALRVKPFVILAGISGTGKTKLPVLAAQATESPYEVIPVRPDWNDSGDLLGYTDLTGNFRAKVLLRQCKKASGESKRQHFAVIDEMNIARVEHYFAEVLSRIEDRSLSHSMSSPLVLSGGKGFDEFKDVGIPSNLAIIGTVNMDESTHGFSKKVLDRAFTLELSEVDLSNILQTSSEYAVVPYGADSWQPQYQSLREAAADPVAEKIIHEQLAHLQNLNAVLGKAQMQLGYRSRDEILLFVLEAANSIEFFKDAAGEDVDPFDLALMMKVLPRIAGSSHAVGRVIDGLLQVAYPATDPSSAMKQWQVNDGPNRLEGARWPRTAARLCLMKERLEDGYTSFFL
jgi:hypothetical protein